ncbi:hypothetical protein HNQ76_002164 [Thermosulfuriphilus ammonigenes]|nr:hypothetical protein [Thermosulfuriphilus ammonigenes]
MIRRAKKNAFRNWSRNSSKKASGNAQRPRISLKKGLPSRNNYLNGRS